MKIFVGLSGGVDSSVAAKLLLDEGHTVTGVFIKIWQPEFLECTWKEDRLAAKRSAAALGIPFLEVDLSEEYKQSIVADMIAGYRAGITPNPDVLCNRIIKFGAFRAWATARGAEKIATGHYARIVESAGGLLELHRGIDGGKDQSYFLYQLTQDDLRGSLFPLGNYTKREVRALAERSELPSARRPDSQGLCFVGDVEVGEFLSRFIPMERGDVLDGRGNIIGRHEGCARYTIGQRHGFELFPETSPTTAHYVVAINTVENSIIVSSAPATSYKSRIALRAPHWIGESPQKDSTYGVSLRYHQLPKKARISVEKDGTFVDFEEPQSVTPGQSAVVYDDGRCLGGGVIASSKE